MIKKMLNEYKPDYISNPRETLKECLLEKGFKDADKIIKRIVRIKNNCLLPSSAEKMERLTGVSGRFWLRRWSCYLERRERTNSGI